MPKVKCKKHVGVKAEKREILYISYFNFASSDKKRLPTIEKLLYNIKYRPFFFSFFLGMTRTKESSKIFRAQYGRGRKGRFVGYRALYVCKICAIFLD